MDNFELSFDGQNSFDFRQDDLFSMRSIPVRQVRRCRRCLVEKPITEFQQNHKRCKLCYRPPEERRLKEKEVRARPITRMETVMRKWFGRGRYKWGLNLLGYGPLQLQLHIESLLKPDMTWDNYGSRPGQWSIHHKKRIRDFDLSNDEQLKICHSLDNLEPLWAIENLRDGAKA